jgi:hypothetical protein
MTQYQSKFINLNKEKGGIVTFRNDVPAKIIGKGTIILGNKGIKVENV